MDIVIDFDGTCVAHEFPKVGRDIGAVPVLQELVKKGHRLILFTMRSDLTNLEAANGTEHPELHLVPGNYLSQAVDWFKENKITLYGIQTNPSQKRFTNSPKAYGQLIIDDAALGVPLIVGKHKKPYVDWILVRSWLAIEGIL